MKLRTLLCCGCLFAATLAGAGTIDDVLAAERARRTALLTGDATALAMLLADDLRYTHSNGKVETKAIVLDGIASKQTAYERFELGGMVIREITPDVAVVNGMIDQRKLGGGKWTDMKLLFHAVWRHESGVWRQVSLQTLQTPAPKP